MELLQIENIDYESKKIQAVFDGILKEGFYVKADFDYEEIQTEFEDERTGLQDYYSAEKISLWDFKTFDTEDNEISINNRENKKIKELVEFKLIELLEDYINNN